MPRHEPESKSRQEAATKPRTTNKRPHPSEPQPVSTRPRASNAEVHAAGAVLWRADAGGGVEVAVIHRPRYDDWSLPKGKLDPGETVAHAAAREVAEETGYACALSRGLLCIDYDVPAKVRVDSADAPRDPGTVRKFVHYFAARAGTGEFIPNAEVDKMVWLPLDEARALLSYLDDHKVLDSFERLPTAAATVLLVRHAKAGSRENFDGDDRLRPLSPAGWEQQRALDTFLPLFGPGRVHSAPRLRCEQTVRSVARKLAVPVRSEPSFTEESYRADPDATCRRLLRIAEDPTPAVVCSQGGVIPDIVARFAADAGLSLGEPTSRKASVWVLTFDYRPRTDNGSAPLPLLVAADYYSEPAPVG